MTPGLRLLLAALLSTAPIAEPEAQELQEYSAVYRASAFGLSASAERRLSRLDTGNYRLENHVHAELAGQTIASLEQVSELTMVDAGVQPLTYLYRLGGLSSGVEAISYDWDRATALSRDGDQSWEVPLLPGVLDQLSHQLALRLELKAAGSGELEFLLIDGDELDSYRYQVLDAEILDTPLGRLDCVQVARVNAANQARTTRFWLARDWDYLLVKLEQVNGSRPAMVLELETATVAGVAVTPLP